MPSRTLRIDDIPTCHLRKRNGGATKPEVVVLFNTLEDGYERVFDFELPVDPTKRDYCRVLQAFYSDREALYTELTDTTTGFVTCGTLHNSRRQPLTTNQFARRVRRRYRHLRYDPGNYSVVVKAVASVDCSRLIGRLRAPRGVLSYDDGYVTYVK